MAEARLRELRAVEEPTGAPARPLFGIPVGPWAADFGMMFDGHERDHDLDYAPGYIPPSGQTTPQYAQGAARSRRLSQTDLYEDTTPAADGGKKRRIDD